MKHWVFNKKFDRFNRYSDFGTVRLLDIDPKLKIQLGFNGTILVKTIENKWHNNHGPAITSIAGPCVYYLMNKRVSIFQAFIS